MGQAGDGGGEGDLVDEGVELRCEAACSGVGSAPRSRYSSSSLSMWKIARIMECATALANFAWPSPGAQPPVLGAEVGVCAAGGLGCFGEVGAEPSRAGAVPGEPVLAGGLVVARAHPRPR